MIILSFSQCNKTRNNSKYKQTFSRVRITRPHQSLPQSEPEMPPTGVAYLLEGRSCCPLAPSRSCRLRPFPQASWVFVFASVCRLCASLRVDSHRAAWSTVRKRCTPVRRRCCVARGSSSACRNWCSTGLNVLLLSARKKKDLSNLT